MRGAPPDPKALNPGRGALQGALAAQHARGIPEPLKSTPVTWKGVRRRTRWRRCTRAASIP